MWSAPVLGIAITFLSSGRKNCFLVKIASSLYLAKCPSLLALHISVEWLAFYNDNLKENQVGQQKLKMSWFISLIVTPDLQ